MIAVNISYESSVYSSTIPSIVTDLLAFNVNKQEWCYNLSRRNMIETSTQLT